MCTRLAFDSALLLKHDDYTTTFADAVCWEGRTGEHSAGRALQQTEFIIRFMLCLFLPPPMHTTYPSIYILHFLHPAHRLPLSPHAGPPRPHSVQTNTANVKNNFEATLCLARLVDGGAAAVASTARSLVLVDLTRELHVYIQYAECRHIPSSRIP